MQIMQNFINRLSALWESKAPQRLDSFIAFVGIFWLGISSLILYFLVRMTGEVLEKEVFSFDESILLKIHQLANPVLDQLMLSITKIGDPGTVVPITLSIFALLLWKRYYLEAKLFALDAFGGAFFSYVLKLTFQKPRPRLWPQIITETTYSYPSGHAIGSIVLYGFLSYLLARIYPDYAKAFYGIAVALILSIGFSRLYLGVHWPTDILAGYSIGFLWVLFCANLLKFSKLKQGNH